MASAFAPPPAVPVNSNDAEAPSDSLAFATVSTYVPGTASSLHDSADPAVARKLPPTDIVRCVPTTSVCFDVVLPPAVKTSMFTSCVDWHGIVVGTITVSCVVVAAVTVAAFPATNTLFAAGFGKNPLPEIVTVLPAVTGSGDTAEMEGTLDPLAADTVIEMVPGVPSLSAVIVAVPGLRPVTKPVASTAAMRLSVDDH